jgi:SSS family solute:Na+ symporter
VVIALDSVSTIIILLYFVGLIAIGALASKKIKNSEDFLVAGRNLGFWTFTILIVASICSGMTILGVAGLGYATGWPSIWEQIFVPLSAAVCILFFGTKLHAVASKTGYVTVQDYFAHRFYSPRGIRGTSAIIGVLISIIYLVGQYVAISMVLSWLFKIPYLWALLIGAFIVTGYTILGGLYAIGMASLVQGIMILVGVLLVGPVVIEAAGGMTHINTVLAGIGQYDPPVVSPDEPALRQVCLPDTRVSGLVLLHAHLRAGSSSARGQQCAGCEGYQVLQMGAAGGFRHLRRDHVPVQDHRIRCPVHGP